MKLHEDADFTLHRQSVILLLELVLYKIFDEGMGDTVYPALKKMALEYPSKGPERRIIEAVVAEIKKDWGELLDEEEASIIEVGSLETEAEDTTDKPREV